MQVYGSTNLKAECISQHDSTPKPLFTFEFCHIWFDFRLVVEKAISYDKEGSTNANNHLCITATTTTTDIYRCMLKRAQSDSALHTDSKVINVLNETLSMLREILCDTYDTDL